MKTSFNLEKFKTYLVPVVSLVAVVVLVPLVVMPQLDQIAADSKIINKNGERLKTLEKKAKDLEAQSQNQDELNSKLQIAEKALPVNKAIAPLILGVQQIAINNSLAVNKVKLQPGKVATGSAEKLTPAATTATSEDLNFKSTDSEIIFEMGLHGSFESLQGFLQVLEKGRRLLIFKSFQSQTVGDGNYNVQIFLVAPFSPLPQLTKDQIASELPQISDKDEELLEKLSSAGFGDVTTTTITPGPTGVANPFQ
jgi:hypothetical protein